MSWAEISIQTTHEATEAVAEIFHEVGATGVVIEDPELVEEYRRSGVWDYCGIPEVEDNSVVTVKAYLIVNAELEDKMSRFKARVEELANYGIDKGKGIITWQEIKEESLLIICGSIQRISRFSEIIVPFMAIAYIILAIV
ncbi:MAG: 50S ribosomal protein L11 methyltransferase, partial [Selenomonadales bacterium]|nr:50S ribosomal protein L11 methyltransferase [Selenomonadales bacterium]